MITVAIVEDEAEAFARIRDFIERFERENGAEAGTLFSVRHYPDALAFLDGYRRTDLVFMDIQMPFINGLEGAARLRKLDGQAVLIFVTNMAQYAVKGYEVDALDFIVKPVAYSDFAFKMKRALRAVEAAKEKEYIIRTRDGIRRLEENDILFVEVHGHTLSYHLPEEVIEVRGRLSDLENDLPSFLKCNNCYLVNPRHIDRVEGYEVSLTDGSTLTISHPRRKAFLEALSRYYSGVGK